MLEYSDTWTTSNIYFQIVSVNKFQSSAAEQNKPANQHQVHIPF
jgi:hypothetical protein